MTQYVCPMHPEVVTSEPGDCPKCGMPLVPADRVKQQTNHAENKIGQYKPLLVIIGLILLVTIALASRDGQLDRFSWQQTMAYFMAGFFLVFSGFKLLDVKGFADGYSTYDLLAQKWPLYGHIYPFIELVLGLAYLVNFQPHLTNVITLIVMTFSGLGVVNSLRQKRQFQCACLGTIIKVPLTTVTLIEDFGMAIMALALLIFRI